jgi:sulfate transport system ATP-binding protein
MAIQIEHLVKRFGATLVVDDVTFEVKTGQLVALLGPSGGGKSTILRIIAGLEQADSGQVRFDDQRVDHLDARTRGVGFVFQHYALFRHMTVAQNVGFGLKVRGVPPAQRRKRVGELLELIGLQALEGRLPDQLSGGQRQRVALARALAPQPRLLLLDEPFAAVDARVREELRRWLRDLHDRVQVTSVFVTHDQQEAFSIADRVAVLHRGRLEQVGTPVEILDMPRTEFVAAFVSEVNVLRGEVRGTDATVGPLRVRLDRDPGNGPARLVVRAWDLHFSRREPANAVVTRVAALGDRVRVEAVLDGGTALFAQVPRFSPSLKEIVLGARVSVEIARGQLFSGHGPPALVIPPDPGPPGGW